MICRRIFPLSFLQSLLIVPTTISMVSGLSSSASAPSQCAVVGCGVLGTSLCRQLLESPDFEGRSGKPYCTTCNYKQLRLLRFFWKCTERICLITMYIFFVPMVCTSTKQNKTQCSHGYYQNNQQPRIYSSQSRRQLFRSISSRYHG